MVVTGSAELASQLPFHGNSPKASCRQNNRLIWGPNMKSGSTVALQHEPLNRASIAKLYVVVFGGGHKL